MPNIIYIQDFEAERKFKLGLAKKIALKASKGMMDHATRGERKQKVGSLLKFCKLLKYLVICKF